MKVDDATRRRIAELERGSRPAPAGTHPVVLGIDPSSTAIGWAVLDAAGPTLLDFGVLRVPSAWPLARRLAEFGPRLRDALGRTVRPTLAAVEISSGRTYRGVRAHSLAALGMGQGVAVAVAALDLGPERVALVTEQEWTGRAPKPRRAALARALFPAYGRYASDGGDRGQDIADAIGLAVWYAARHAPEPAR